MKTYLHFCAYFESNFLNIYWCNNVLKKNCKQIWNIFYVQYTFLYPGSIYWIACFKTAFPSIHLVKSQKIMELAEVKRHYKLSEYVQWAQNLKFGGLYHRLIFKHQL
jgi:hypothetical protein